MGIKTVKYKANSIVYFQGDKPNRVYILKKGSIVTKATDLKTNEDILTMIKVGEFLGVKNVISNQPYSETVSTLTDSELVVFYKEDFEFFILSNTRIMMQTLVVFSNQLRKIHKDIKELNTQADSSYKSPDAEEDLYELGRFFKSQHKEEYSSYCFNKYKDLYPNGKFNDAIDSGGTVSSFSSDSSIEDYSDDEKLEEDTALDFQEGENYLDEENFAKAHECFVKVINVPDGYHRVDAIYLNGAALFKMKNYKACLQNYGKFLSEHKDYKKIDEVMFYVGCSYKEIGDLPQSELFLKQVMKRAEGKPLAQLALKALKGI